VFPDFLVRRLVLGLLAAGDHPVFLTFMEYQVVSQEFPVFFVQMNCGAFLIPYLSPDA
jgi:hypothetical protein